MELCSNPSAIYTKWCAQNFSLIFGFFAIFDRNLAKIVAPPSDECENYVACLKVQSLPKKTIQTASKSAYKWQRNACSNYAPLERTALRTRSVTKKNKQKNKHHIFAPTAGARCTIFPKLCMVIEFVVPIRKVPFIFRSNVQFSYNVYGKIWPNLPTRGFSAITP